MQLTARAMRHTPRAAVSSRFVSLFAFLILPIGIFYLNKEVLNNVALKLELYTALEMPDLQFKIISNFHLKYLAIRRSSFKNKSLKM